MISKFNKFNESVKDHLKPKSEEEIEKGLGKLTPYELLILGITEDYFEGVQKALDLGVELDRNLGRGFPLIKAVECFNLEALKFLLDNGADVNVFGGKALSRSCHTDKIEITRTLLEYGADPNLDGCSPLSWAIQLRNINLVKLLIEYKAKVTSGIVMYAEEMYAGEEIIHLLKQHSIHGRFKKFLGFNESVRDLMKPKDEEEIIKSTENMTPIRKVIKGIEFDYPWLVKQGIDDALKHRERIVNSDTLAVAVQKGNMEIIKILADSGISGINSSYIIQSLCKKGNVEIAKYLIEKGINANTVLVDDFYTLIKRDDCSEILGLLVEVSPILKAKLVNKSKLIARDLDKINKYL